MAPALTKTLVCITDLLWYFSNARSREKSGSFLPGPELQSPWEFVKILRLSVKLNGWFCVYWTQK